MSAEGLEKTVVSEESKPNQDPATSGENKPLEETRKRSRLRWKKKDMPGGLWIKCDACSQTVYRKDLEDNDMVCPMCSFHFTVTGSERVKMVADPDTYEERFADLTAMDRLGFENEGSYKDKIERTTKKTGHSEHCSRYPRVLNELINPRQSHPNRPSTASGLNNVFTNVWRYCRRNNGMCSTSQALLVAWAR